MSASSGANLSGQVITNLRYPTNADDAASKQYVDDAVAGGTTVALALAQGTITTAVPVISATSTWNAGGVTFTGVKLNVTNTASAAASMLMDLQTGGASRFTVVASTGFAGHNTQAPSTVIDAFGWTLTLGADNGAATSITRTDTSTKQAAVVCAHSTNAEEQVCMLQCSSGGGINNLALGGGLGQYNAATNLYFFTGAGQTTLTGTQRGLLNASGLAIGNVVSAQSGRLHLQEDNALTGAAYPLIYGIVTWNAGGTTHIGQQIIITDTASAAASLLQDWKIGANSVFQVRKDGSPLFLGNTAVPAGGTTGAGIRMSTTANLGVFFGSGAPTLSAAKGSIYMRTDGSSTSTRMYVNTDGATAWTNVTTAT